MEFYGSAGKRLRIKVCALRVAGVFSSACREPSSLIGKVKQSAALGKANLLGGTGQNSWMGGA
jgi:hypothetical protein